MSQSVEVNGRTFTYRRPTISIVRTLAQKGYEQAFSDMGAMFGDKKEYRRFCKTWKSFCGDVMMKDWKWNLGFFPSELNPDNLPVDSVLEVAQGFFDLLAETQKKVEKQLSASKGSATVNHPE